MNNQLFNKDFFSVCPGSLNVSNKPTETISEVYRQFLPDLAALCQKMQVKRKQMLQEGFSADFSDRESELAYLMVRALKPDVIVEISPRHGYSTNYLLAAITDNKHGKLFSFEIDTHANGKPIEKAIRENLLPGLNQEAFQLTIGDAMAATIPDPDFLFIDSCHESYFASWYLSKLVARSNYVFVHDILVFDQIFETLIPKAALLGIREQYYVLEALALNEQPCFATAAINWFLPGDFFSNLAQRNPGAPDRAIVFPGHAPTGITQKLHEGHKDITSWQKQAIAGATLSVIKNIHELVNSSQPDFLKLEALRLLPFMGYKFPIHPNEFPKWEPDLKNITFARFAQTSDYLATSFNFKALKKLFSQPCSSLNSNSLQVLKNQFLALSGKRNCSPTFLLKQAQNFIKKNFTKS